MSKSIYISPVESWWVVLLSRLFESYFWVVLLSLVELSCKLQNRTKTDRDTRIWLKTLLYFRCYKTMIKEESWFLHESNQFIWRMNQINSFGAHCTWIKMIHFVHILIHVIACDWWILDLHESKWFIWRTIASFLRFIVK